ncbi:hypothetical protein SUGI_1115400 [Cryptomeria japonica]|nr:hypothetical protein SUGI_1115400 [Cryptomeria japonica]
MKVLRGEGVLIKPCAGKDQQNGQGCLGINLNDDGVFVIEGEADGRIADAMPFHPSEFLLELIPPTPTMVVELLLLQFTRFACGGLVIGLASHHYVANGQAATFFMNSWGKVVRGESILALVNDRSLLKASDPPQPCFDHLEYNTMTHDQFPIMSSLITKKFHFDAIFLQKLKSTVNGSDKSKKPYTTFEILVAHMWKCITKARGLDGDVKTKVSILVDGRKKVEFSLASRILGQCCL